MCNKYEIVSELSCLLERFKQGKPIERPVILLETAEQVANQYYENEQKNIDEWAEKLAEDLSKLSD